MVSVHEVANYFILRGKEDGFDSGEFLTHLKLQKLIYFAQAWYLGLTGGEALFGEPLQAWVHGPVARAVYDQFKGSGWAPIEEPYGDPVTDTAICSFLDEVWEAYSVYSAKRLEALTHQDVPWVEARAGLPSGQHSSNVISIESMTRVYTQLAASNGA